MPWYKLLDRWESLFATLVYVLLLACCAVVSQLGAELFSEKPVPPLRQIPSERWVFFAATLVGLALAAELPFISFPVSESNDLWGFPFPYSLHALQGPGGEPRLPLTLTEKKLDAVLQEVWLLAGLLDFLIALGLQRLFVWWALRRFAGGWDPAGPVPAASRFDARLLTATRVLLVMYCPILVRLPYIWTSVGGSREPILALMVCGLAGVPGLALFVAWCHASLWILGAPCSVRGRSRWGALLALALLGYPTSWLSFLGTVHDWSGWRSGPATPHRELAAREISRGEE